MLLTSKMKVGVLPRAPVFSGCNVSSRRPPSEGGGRGCKSRHPDQFGWLAEQKCPGPENRVSLRAAWVQSLHHPPSSCSSIAERPVDNRKTQERYLPGRPLSSSTLNERKTMKTPIRFQSRLLNRRSYQPRRRLVVAFRPATRLVLSLSPITQLKLQPQKGN